ncbi:ABC transporter ATP-binding protein [Solitalea koreensis]|uniref:Phospholipid/cholesterol/gamma-HCH transport system ATP-binding protein n=1 Tax=Solitalea koreensis TaxID=543615 RepID=A0A521BE95_9SPHI|nr:ATP-binding cassette domain-containing protein [Solitalea koreensis]SMO45427.1 phospholipid/cholesterol/gamma-HCH transport system ATP-binding protein [Solitalea koreensis]
MKNGVKIDRNNRVIFVKDLEKSFGELNVLSGLNMDLFKGENLVVMGRSGSGKSVLIKVISGLLKPDKGVVNVLGQEVDKISTEELQALRLKIGFSFQSSALYDSMTVRENLEFPLVRNLKNIKSKEVDKAIEEVLENVDLPQTINQLPSELSGGQKKRIGIARTLILKPEIMLYDEPTAGLDPITSVEINNLINEVQQKYNTSSLIITHDLTCAKLTGDRVAMIVDGNFLTQGSFDDVFNTNDERIRGFYNYNFINDNTNKKLNNFK